MEPSEANPLKHLRKAHKAVAVCTKIITKLLQRRKHELWTWSAPTLFKSSTFDVYMLSQKVRQMLHMVGDVTEMTHNNRSPAHSFNITTSLT